MLQAHTCVCTKHSDFFKILKKICAKKNKKNISIFCILIRLNAPLTVFFSLLLKPTVYHRPEIITNACLWNVACLICSINRIWWILWYVLCTAVCDNYLNFYFYLYSQILVQIFIFIYIFVLFCKTKYIRICLKHVYRIYLYLFL